MGPSFEDLPVLKGTYARHSFTPDLGRHRISDGCIQLIFSPKPTSAAYSHRHVTAAVVVRSFGEARGEVRSFFTVIKGTPSARQTDWP